MRSILILVNIVLSIAAAGITYNLLRPHDTDASASMIPPPMSVDEPIASESYQNPNRNKRMNSRIGDKIWVHNLFHPDREYEEIISADIKIEDEEQATEHFELISIAQIHDRSCASIRVIAEQNNPRGRPSRARARARRVRTSGKGAEANQKVYMLNDPVGKTGFFLSKISINEVMLKKGEQEIALRLNKGDDGSEQRRQQFAKAEAVKTQKEKAERIREAAQAKSRAAAAANDAKTNDTSNRQPARSSSPPPPPPPPPAVNKEAAPAPAQNSESNTTKRRRELRNQYLKRIREGS